MTSLSRLALLSLIMPSVALAQAPDTLPEAKPLSTSDVVIYATDPAYPSELARAGVQGKMIVLATLGADGKPERTAIHESSRSAQLDQIAQTYVGKLGYKGDEKNPIGPGTKLLIPVEFTKDTFAELPNKTCNDLNIDLAYFTTTFPEAKPSDLRFFNLATGALFFIVKSEQRIPFAKSVKVIVANSIAHCAAHPENKVFAVMKQALDASVAK
jgi:TonB family protein